MALLTDDCDITDCTFYMNWGGNGDPYIILMETKPKFKKWYQYRSWDKIPVNQI